MNLILLGPPGVGKGTQAATLCREFGLTSLATGDLFRAEMAAGTPLGRQAEVYIRQGELVPDDITIGMVRGRLEREKERGCGFLLDGFPRTLEQARALEGVLGELGLTIDAVLSLEADDEVIVRRLSGRRVCPVNGEVYHVETRPPRVEGKCDSCGADLVTRPDDAPEAIRTRLRVFHERTRPLIDFYESRGLLRRIDAGGTPEQVYERITDALR